MNQGGYKLTVVPFGCKTEVKYVSVLFPTFLKLRWRVRDFVTAEAVTEGRFKFAGWLSE